MKRKFPDPNRIYHSFEDYTENTTPGAAQTRRDIARESWEAATRSAFEMARLLAVDFGHEGLAETLRVLAK